MSTSDYPEPFIVKSPADLPRAIALAEGSGSIGLAHLLRAFSHGRIAFGPIVPETSVTTFKAWTKRTSDRVAIALIGDDDGADRGPVGWPIAERIVAWSRTVMIHSADAEIRHYECAIVAAELSGGRGLIVECGTHTLGGWLELVSEARHRPSTLVLMPESPHPVPLDRGRMQ